MSFTIPQPDASGGSTQQFGQYAGTFLNCYIQRMSATAGLNSTPTEVELTLVPGDINNGHDVSGTYTNGIGVGLFDSGNAVPGRFSGFQLGNFKFCGILQSWEANNGSNGRTYSAKLVDPRVIFDHVYINLDGNRSFNVQGISASGVPNYLDVMWYYNLASDALLDQYGVSAGLVRQFLSSGGDNFSLPQAYGQPFRLYFESSFLQGIPDWYRINSKGLSLAEFLQKNANDFNKDYYVVTDYDAWQAGSGILPLKVYALKKTDTTNDDTIFDFVEANRSSGLMVNSRVGKELYVEPQTVILRGAPFHQWLVAVTGSRFWGYDNKYGIPIITDVDDPFGVVPLDHIVGTGIQVLTETYTITGQVYLKDISSDASAIPEVVTTTVNYDVPAYFPTNQELDAALFNQKSWECLCYMNNYNFAQQIGITKPPFKPYTEFVSGVLNGLSGVFTTGVRIPWNVLNTELQNLDNRTDIQEALIETVYQATKSQAENYYGRRWFSSITPFIRTRERSLPAGTFKSFETKPLLDFEVSEGGWIGSDTYPTSLLGHSGLKTSNDSKIRLQDGRVKPFVGFCDESNFFFATNGPVYTGYADSNSFLDERIVVEKVNSSGLATIWDVPMIVEQYVENPNFAVWGIDFDIRQEYKYIGVTGSDYIFTFLNFAQAMGYPIFTNVDFNGSPVPTGYDLHYVLINTASSTFGLPPPKIQKIESSNSLPTSSHGSISVGPCFPIKLTNAGYGPYVYFNPSGAGVKIIDDPSFAPWTYNSDVVMALAGQDITNLAVASANVVDSANFTMAGLPLYSFGDAVAVNNNLTSISVQYGPDGVTTSYNLRTFAGAPYKISPLLLNNNYSVALEAKKITQTTNFNDRVETRTKNTITKVEDFKGLQNAIPNGGSYLVGTVSPANINNVTVP